MKKRMYVFCVRIESFSIWSMSDFMIIRLSAETRKCYRNWTIKMYRATKQMKMYVWKSFLPATLKIIVHTFLMYRWNYIHSQESIMSECDHHRAIIPPSWEGGLTLWLFKTCASFQLSINFVVQIGPKLNLLKLLSLTEMLIIRLV